MRRTGRGGGGGLVKLFCRAAEVGRVDEGTVDRGNGI